MSAQAHRLRDAAALGCTLMQTHPTAGPGDAPAPVEPSWAQTLRDGTPITIRPILARDVELERRFIEGLLPSSRRFRFLESMTSPSAALLKQLTSIDPLTDVAYVAVMAVDSREREIGVGRFSAAANGCDCEFAVTVSDEWHGKGLGTLLMGHLIDAARARGLKTMHSSDAADNSAMRKFAEHLHFRHERDPDDATQVLYSVDLGE